ncbi:hypothetical protein LUX34_05905 [Streptomyces werraensis]|nr:hypothetical protein [Streptomyces werraensis]
MAMTGDSPRNERSRPETDPVCLWREWRPEDEAAPTEAVVVVDDHVTMRVWNHTLDRLSETLAESFTSVLTVSLLGSDETLPSRVRTEPPLDAPAAGTRRVVLVVTDALAAGWHLGAAQPLLRSWAQSWPVAVIDLLPPHLWFRTGLDVLHVQVTPPRPWSPNTEWSWHEKEFPARVGSEPAFTSRSGELNDDEALVVVPVLSLAHHGARALSEVLAATEEHPLDLPATPPAPGRVDPTQHGPSHGLWSRLPTSSHRPPPTVCSTSEQGHPLWPSAWARAWPRHRSACR